MTGSRPDGDAIWGLREAGIAWVLAQVAALVGVVAILAVGGWTTLTPAQPGGYIGRAVAQVANGDDPSNDSWPFVFQQLALIPLWVGLLGGAWLVAGLLGRARPGWRIIVKPIDIALGLAAGVLLQLAIPVLYVFVQLIFGELEPSNRAQRLADQVESVPLALMLFLFVAVGAPVVEELFYRGLVQRALIDRLGPSVGIGTAGLLFGAVHFSLIELPALVMVGVVLGVLAWRTGRLGPAIIAHMTFNAVTLVLLLTLR